MEHTKKWHILLKSALYFWLIVIMIMLIMNDIDKRGACFFILGAISALMTKALIDINEVVII